MLPDYKQLVFSALRLRHLHIFTLQVTFGGGNGTPTIDTPNSSPSIVGLGTGAGGLAFTGTAGNYTLNMPRGLSLHFLGGEWSIPVTGSPILTPTIVSAAGGPLATAGTLNLQTLVNAGTAGTPADASRLYLTFLIGKS